MTKPAVVKPPLSVCHLADVHLGYRRFNRVTKSGHNQREIDVNVAFREAVSRVIELKPDITIIAGDLFHSVRPSNSIVAFAFRELKRLAKKTNAPIVIIAGNHDSPKRSDTGCILRLFSEIEGVHVADVGIEKFSFPQLGLSVHCIPHAALSGLQETPPAADPRFPHNILVLHAQIGQEWTTDLGGINVDLESLSPREWDYIALGHVHFHQRVAFNAAYPGALEHTSPNIWAEAKESRGFLGFELPSGQSTFYPLTSPRPIVVLSPIHAETMQAEEVLRAIKDALEEVPGGIEGKLVRLEVGGVSRETLRALDHKEIRRLRTLALNLTIEFRAHRQTAKSSEVVRVGAARLADELKGFCSSWSFERVSAAEATTTIEHLLSRVEAEEADSR